MSFVVKIEAPISNYMGDDVFFKELYFECNEVSPSRDEVINALDKLDEEYRKYDEYYGEEAEALEIVQLVDEWRTVRPNGCLYTNTFVEHPTFGKQPFTWKVISPIVIN